MVATSSLDIDIDVSKSASSPHQLFQPTQFWKRALACSRQLTLRFCMARDTSERAIWTMPLLNVRFGT